MFGRGPVAAGRAAGAAHRPHAGDDSAPGARRRSADAAAREGAQRSRAAGDATTRRSAQPCGGRRKRPGTQRSPAAGGANDAAPNAARPRATQTARRSTQPSRGRRNRPGAQHSQAAGDATGPALNAARPRATQPARRSARPLVAVRSGVCWHPGSEAWPWLTARVRRPRASGPGWFATESRVVRNQLRSASTWMRIAPNPRISRVRCDRWHMDVASQRLCAIRLRFGPESPAPTPADDLRRSEPRLRLTPLGADRPRRAQRPAAALSASRAAHLPPPRAARSDPAPALSASRAAHHPRRARPPLPPDRHTTAPDPLPPRNPRVPPRVGG